MVKKFFVALIVILIVAAAFFGYQYYRKTKTGVFPAPDQALLSFPTSETSRIIEPSVLRIPDFEEKTIFVQPKTQTEETILGLQVPSFPVSFDYFFSKPSTEEPQKIQSQPPYFQDFIKRVQEAVSGAEQKIEERSVAAPLEASPGASGQKIEISTKEIKLNLTPEEFNILYPDYFIKNLQEIQVFIKSYDPDYQIITEIKTDPDVRRIEESIVFSLFSANMLTRDEVERYLTTIRFTLPQLQISELEIRNSAGSMKKTEASFTGFLKGIFSNLILRPGFSVAFLDKKTFSNKLSLTYALIEKLQHLAVKSAKAKGPCGYCYVLPECYQVGPPNPVPGANTWAPYCYCTGCWAGYGCLSRCAGQSAIWDPTTGICGCG